MIHVYFVASVLKNMYKVMAVNGEKVLETYCASACPRDSQNFNNTHKVSSKILRQWARQTANMLGREYSDNENYKVVECRWDKIPS